MATVGTTPHTSLFCLGVACWVVPELGRTPLADSELGGWSSGGLEIPGTPPVGGTQTVARAAVGDPREELSFDGDLAMLGVLLLCFAVSGFTMGLLDTGGNVAVMHLWAGGDTSGEGSNTVGRGTGAGRWGFVQSEVPR